MTLKPGIADSALLDLLLSNPAKLTDAQLESFTALASDPIIRSGQAGLLRGDRDRAMAIARALDLLPKVADKPRGKGSLMHSDAYSERRTAGTEYAERLLGMKLPSKPPGRGAGA